MFIVSVQGPRNLYGRGGKFCPTFKSGTEKHLCSLPFLMTLMSPKCTKLHRFTSIFSKNFWVNTPGSPNCRGVKPPPQTPPPRRAPSPAHRPTFSEFPLPLSQLLCKVTVTSCRYYINMFSASALLLDDALKPVTPLTVFSCCF